MKKIKLYGVRVDRAYGSGYLRTYWFVSKPLHTRFFPWSCSVERFETWEQARLRAMYYAQQEKA